MFASEYTGNPKIICLYICNIVVIKYIYSTPSAKIHKSLENKQNNNDVGAIQIF